MIDNYHIVDKNNLEAGEGFCPSDVKKIVFLDIDGVLKTTDPSFKSARYKTIDIPSFYAKLYDLTNIDYSKYGSYGELVIKQVYYDFDRTSVEHLKLILTETGAKFVLSSDWRECGRELMFAAFKILDLHHYYIDDTIDLWKNYKREKYIQDKYSKVFRTDMCTKRTLEIYDYLDRYPHIKQYVAIDDKDLLPGLENHFVRTHALLYKVDALAAIKLLT